MSHTMQQYAVSHTQLGLRVVPVTQHMIHLTLQAVWLATELQALDCASI